LLPWSKVSSMSKIRYPEFTVYHLLLNTLDSNRDGIAIVDAGRGYSYAELGKQASSLAGTLLEQGLRRGDRVGIYLEKCWESVVAILAVAQSGGVFVNINPLLKEGQVHHIMANCGVRMLIADSAKLQGTSLPAVEATLCRGADCPPLSWSRKVMALSEALEHATRHPTATSAMENDLATIIYTSGSTGRPKGIMWTHHNLVAGAQIVSTYLENSCEDRVLSVLPFNFDYGLSQLTTMVRVGGTLVLPRSLLPGDILHSLRQDAVTGLAGVPPVWTLLLQNRRSLARQPLTHLRYITNSGGMIPGTYLEQLRQLLPQTKIYLMYGLTEAFRSTYLPPEEVHRGPACIGRAIPNTDIWVVDEEGRECAPGEVGELVHRGPTVAMGYWGDEEKTQAVYRPNPFAPPETREADKVVYSGDLVKRDEEGFLYFVGRRDELIKTEGYRVSPQEVEELLYSIPAIHEAAVFGEKDPLLGQRIVAVVSLKNGSHCVPEEIRELCSQKAPHYLVPRVIHLLREVPKTATGKIDRSRLRHEYAKGQD